MKKLCIILLIFNLFILTSCSSFNKPNTDLKSDTTTADSTTDNTKILTKNDYFEISQTNSLMYYTIYDKSHNPVISEGPLSKEPHIDMVDELLIRVTTQAGASLLTQSGYYYDIEKNATSELFTCIFDQYDNKVVLGSADKITIRDIFDTNGYFYEISSFNYPLSSKSVEPITDAKFSSDGTSIVITYLSGENYTEVTQTFYLY